MASIALLALIGGVCTRVSTGFINAQPPDLYAALPSLADVRTLLGDNTWWPGFIFAASTTGALLICRSTADTEAASRACEAPLSRVIALWKSSLRA